MSLFAPLAVPVEVRLPDRRIFRLSRCVAEHAVILERPAPFEPGHPVMVTFTLPDADDAVPPTSLAVRAVVALTDADGEGNDGGRELEFVDPPREARDLIVRYVAGRLGLPGRL